MSVVCAVCGRKVRVTKLQMLARHRDEYGHVCDNTGREQRPDAADSRST